MNVTVNGKTMIDGAEYEFNLRLSQIKVPLKPSVLPIKPVMQPNVESTLSPRLLRVPEVAQILGIGRSQAYVLLRTGEIPGKVKFGDSIRVSAEALTKWISDKVALE